MRWVGKIFECTSYAILHVHHLIQNVIEMIQTQKLTNKYVTPSWWTFTKSPP